MASNATISGAGSVVFTLILLAAPLATLLMEFGAGARQIVFSAGLLVASGCVVTAYVKVSRGGGGGYCGGAGGFDGGYCGGGGGYGGGRSDSCGDGSRG